MTSDPKREVLRHALATIAFRGGIALRDAPAGFAEFRVTESTRSPVEILAHIGDLIVISCAEISFVLNQGLCHGTKR